MTNETLRALCVAAQGTARPDEEYWYLEKDMREGYVPGHQDFAYIAAMDPTTTLALLDEIERLNATALMCAENWKRVETERDALRAEIDHLKDTDAYNTDIIQRFGVKVERLRTLLQASTDALCLPCDRWNKDQALIVTRCVEANNLELSK